MWDIKIPQPHTTDFLLALWPAIVLETRKVLSVSSFLAVSSTVASNPHEEGN